VLPLYESVFSVLHADDALRGLLGADEDDPHIYQTFIQFHSEAAVRNRFWVCFDKLSDVADGTEQTQAIREIRLALHVFGRDANSDVVDRIDDQLRVILDGANLSTPDLLAWYCLQEGSSTRTFEVDQQLWHAISVYRCKVAATIALPS